MQAVAVLGADHQESRVIFVKMCENAETTPSENIIRWFAHIHKKTLFETHPQKNYTSSSRL